MDAALKRHDGELDVFTNAHRAEGRRHLKCSPDAECKKLAWIEPVETIPCQCHRAAIERYLAADRIEARGLPGAVGTYHGDDFCGRDVEAHVAQRRYGAVALHEISRL